jgi:hypothetical protein
MPLEVKLANYALAEDAGVLAGLLSPGYSAANGGFSRRILAAMFAVDPCPPGPVMMNDVDFARHDTHSFEAQVRPIALRGVAAPLISVRDVRIACLPSSLEHRLSQSRREGCSEPSPV